LKALVDSNSQPTTPDELPTIELFTSPNIVLPESTVEGDFYSYTPGTPKVVRVQDTRKSLDVAAASSSGALFSEGLGNNRCVPTGKGPRRALRQRPPDPAGQWTLQLFERWRGRGLHRIQHRALGPLCAMVHHRCWAWPVRNRHLPRATGSPRSGQTRTSQELTLNPAPKRCRITTKTTPGTGEPT
jgi:hypothetical protein